MTLIRLSELLAVCLLLAGCAGVQYRPGELPVPPRPVLTPIPASALQCLAPDTYTTLVNRERALRTWGMESEAVLKENNAKAGGQ